VSEPTEFRAIKTNDVSRIVQRTAEADKTEKSFSDSQSWGL